MGDRLGGLAVTAFPRQRERTLEDFAVVRPQPVRRTRGGIEVQIVALRDRRLRAGREGKGLAHEQGGAQPCAARNRLACAARNRLEGTEQLDRDLDFIRILLRPIGDATLAAQSLNVCTATKAINSVAKAPAHRISTALMRQMTENSLRIFKMREPVSGRASLRPAGPRSFRPCCRSRPLGQVRSGLRPRCVAQARSGAFARPLEVFPLHFRDGRNRAPEDATSPRERRARRGCARARNGRRWQAGTAPRGAETGRRRVRTCRPRARADAGAGTQPSRT